MLALAVAKAGVLPAPKVLEGPSSKTTIVGPDGSKITAFAPGGKILLEENAGPVLQEAPEVVAVAGVAQPLPIAPVVEVKSDGDAPVKVSVNSVESVEAVDLARGATTENDTQIEGTTVSSPTSTEEIPREPNTESSEILEIATDVPTSKETVSVVPLVNGEVPVAVEAASQPLVGYINGAPFYVPQVKELEGEYVPENLFEEKILG